MTSPTPTDPQVLLESPPPPSASAAPPIPERPSRAQATIWAIAVGIVVLASTASLNIDWTHLGEVPGRIVKYLGLMFSEPNFDKFPRALTETWRSI
jgi:phosphonate transport system permease protein